MTSEDDSEVDGLAHHSAQDLANRATTHLRAGEVMAAIECSEAALQAQPGHPRALWVMGRICLDSERLAQGMSLLFQAAKGAPRDPDIVEALAHGLGLQRRWREAESLIIRGIKAHPKSLPLQLQKCQILRRQGRMKELADQLLPLIAEHPTDPDLRVLLARAHKGLRRRERAMQELREALVHSPNHFESLFLLGCLLNEGGRLEEAESFLQRVLELRPDFKEGSRVLANNLSLQGAQERALKVLDVALEHNPGALGLLWLRLSAVCEVFDSEDHAQQCRERFVEDLAELERQSVEGIALPEEICTVFALHYLEPDPLDFQRRIGAMVARIMAHAWPKYCRPLPPVRIGPGDRIRIGVVSSHFRAHTVEWLFRGWIRGLNRERFEVICYYIDRGLHRPCQATVDAADSFLFLPPQLGSAAARIAQDSPHVLLYPEVGMEASIVRLAALRLAPIQCLAWGHPVTTGLDTMDYFLTSDAMEAIGGEEQYSEQLVHLPSLSVELDPPSSPEPVKRTELGLPEQGLIYLAGQSFQKYRPEHDGIFGRILRRVPGARIAFIQNKRSQNTERFRARIERAIHAEGLDPSERILFLPRASPSGFVQLLSVCDVYLDTPGWSGGKTSFEAISVGLPPVTWPGSNMRSRHTFAMLQELNIPELIAESAEDYVRIAVQLGVNQEFREQQRQRLLQIGPDLFGNSAGTRALELWIQQTLEIDPV